MLANLVVKEVNILVKCTRPKNPSIGKVRILKFSNRERLTALRLHGNLYG